VKRRIVVSYETEIREEKKQNRGRNRIGEETEIREEKKQNRRRIVVVKRKRTDCDAKQWERAEAQDYNTCP
jgi:hypothetical protein